MNELVSVIIPCRNEESVIGRLLMSIRSQTYSKVEIIVVDNNSTDRTKEIAKEFTKNIYNIGPERSAQRNYGAKKGKGDYLLFLDADMELTDNVVQECMVILKNNPTIGAISIPEKSIAKTFWEKIKAYERSFYNLEGDSTTDAPRFFSRALFNRCGGYDTSITGPEDWDLRNTILRLGYQIDRVSAIIYHYERISSLHDLLKKKYYYALKTHRYLSKHKISLMSSDTIYFMRPVFYRNFDRLITHPILSVGMIVVLSFELLVGSLGYLVGKIKRL